MRSRSPDPHCRWVDNATAPTCGCARTPSLPGRMGPPAGEKHAGTRAQLCPCCKTLTSKPACEELNGGRGQMCQQPPVNWPGSSNDRLLLMQRPRVYSEVVQDQVGHCVTSHTLRQVTCQPEPAGRGPGVVGTEAEGSDTSPEVTGTGLREEEGAGPPCTSGSECVQRKEVMETLASKGSTP